jgi:hypothetical protein
MHKEHIEFGLGWPSNLESILENFGGSGVVFSFLALINVEIPR